MCAVFVVVALFFVLCFSQDIEKDASLRFYNRSLDQFKEFSLDRASEILSSPWYNPDKEIVIFAHGFTVIIKMQVNQKTFLLNLTYRSRPDGPAVLAVLQAYLNSGSNVALLNWQHMAAPVQNTLPSSYVNWAAPNARKLGSKFADTLQNLQAAGLNLNTTHLVGHSLGAQVFGITGNNLAAKGIQLPWITGLDPASIGFENKPLPNKLHSGSAAFVDIIHSDPSKYGYKKSMGTVDFWPNFRNGGPVVQPGCGSASPMFTPQDLCNHNRSWQYLVDALNHKNTIIGSYAKNYRVWKNYSKEERRLYTLPLGRLVPTAKHGDYFFVTRDASPYGLGEDGL